MTDTDANYSRDLIGYGRTPPHALARFLDYVQAHDKVWITRRIDIAQHWRATHPFCD